MSQVADQAYLNTRVSVMAARLFAPSLVERLAHLPLPALVGPCSTIRPHRRRVAVRSNRACSSSCSRNCWCSPMP